MKVVNQPIMKKDAMALVTGKPVFTNDKAPKECLIVKLLRSPYANAMIKSINTQFAMKVPGIEAIYTWEDVPQERFTMAGQTYPEHLQRFPARYSLISSSLGSGISLNNAIAFMIIPGLQNPHCSAPWFAIKAPNSAASSCSPSKVSILCPSTLAARMEHDKIGWSSINTVHNPQFDVSHPRFTL